MGAIHSRWRRSVVQVAVILLLVQTAFGAIACNRFASLAAEVSGLAITPDTICSVHGFTQFSKDEAPNDDDSSRLQHQCPVCQSGVCHLSIVLASEIGLYFTSEGTAEFDGLLLTSRPSAPNWVFHNRGPPLLRI
jgi:hypothetical protein